MLTGSVNRNLLATISVSVNGPTGIAEPVDAAIDTGFTGFLTMPADVIRRLQLKFAGFGSAQLADGSASTFRRFEASVRFGMAIVDVLVLESKGGPLLGMSMLKGHRLTIDVVQGGAVSVTGLHK